MKKKTRILFVCKGNIFRSMTAEYMMKKYLTQHKITDFVVSSAGIEAKPHIADPYLVADLKKRKIDVSKHQQRKLNKELLEQQDIVIAMGQNHKDFIWQQWKRRVFLFNELAYDQKTPVLDIEEHIPANKLNEESREKYEKHIVDHIQKWTPAVFTSLNERHFLFENFISKRARHRDKLPFIPLYETKYTIAFMSIAIPWYEDGHVLIIPKKRFRDIEEIPAVYLQDLMKAVKIIGAVVKQTHTGYNLLLNNGEDAGQYILHLHFHLIPRQVHDHITIEFFKKQKMSPAKFTTYNTALKNKIKDYLKKQKKSK
ncbi:MAG: HIT domain-containing protein [candidate division SR1 bacterium]|nr:HIT domain-containing protein [candidate division SR1 bacterium]